MKRSLLVASLSFAVLSAGCGFLRKDKPKEDEPAKTQWKEPAAPRKATSDKTESASPDRDLQGGVKVDDSTPKKKTTVGAPKTRQTEDIDITQRR
jgi:hypothetical protein